VTGDDAFEGLLDSGGLATAPDVTLAFKDGDGGHRFRRLVVSDGLAESFRTLLNGKLDGLRGRIARGTTRLIEHEPGYKPDPRNEVAWASTEDVPFLAAVLDELPAPGVDVPPYTGDEEHLLPEMSFFVLDGETGDGDDVRAFSRITKSKEVTRGPLKGKVPARMVGDRFEALEETTLVFEPRFFAIEHQAYLYVLNQHYVEQAFGYIDRIRDVAEETLDTIDEKVPIDNVDEFRQAALRHPNKIRKLRNIHNKAYLDGLSVDQIEEAVFSRVDPDTVGVGVTGEGDERALVYDPDHPWALLTLLEDKLVEGLLSQEVQEANSTRPLEDE
jgi:hypothetical protein